MELTITPIIVDLNTHWSTYYYLIWQNIEQKLTQDSVLRFSFYV